MNTFALDKEYIAGTYGRFPVEIVDGKGYGTEDTCVTQSVLGVGVVLGLLALNLLNAVQLVGVFRLGDKAVDEGGKEHSTKEE